MRADKFFAARFGSRTKAAEAIEKGLVLSDGKPVKRDTEIKETSVFTILEAKEHFVSNGGYKLERALKTFDFSCEGGVFADIGASTGGFTDCLLQHGAKRVYAIDVGESLLHESLLSDERIVVMENTNARYLTKASFSEPLDGVVTDVSFISLRLIFPVIKDVLQDNGSAFVLIKPQFECENKHIGKSGIVAPSAHPKIVEKVLSYLSESSLYPHGIINAPVRKGKNIEYVLYCKPTRFGSLSTREVVKQVECFVRHNSVGNLF